MPKGQPWTRKEEADLRKWTAEKKASKVIAKEMGKTEDAVLAKVKRLGLEVVEAESCRNPSTTSRLSLPRNLMSVEEALVILAGALKTACSPGLDKVEVQRLQVVATIAKTYKEILADYLDYRGIETQLVELTKEYERLAKSAPTVPAA